jgi:hypothetical protein
LQIIQGPLSIIGGIGFGVLWGLLAKYVPEKQDVSSVSPFCVLVTAGLERFNNQKKHYIQNYLGQMKTSSFLFCENYYALKHKLKGHEFINRINELFQQKGN